MFSTSPIFHTIATPHSFAKPLPSIKGLGRIGCLIQRHVFLHDFRMRSGSLCQYRLAEGQRRAHNLPILQRDIHTRDRIKTFAPNLLARIDSRIGMMVYGLFNLPKTTLDPFMDALPPIMDDPTIRDGLYLRRYTIHLQPNLAVISGQWRDDPGVVLAMVVLPSPPSISQHQRMAAMRSSLSFRESIPSYLPHLLDETRPIRYV